MDYFICRECERKFNDGQDVMYAFLTVAGARLHEETEDHINESNYRLAELF